MGIEYSLRDLPNMTLVKSNEMSGDETEDESDEEDEDEEEEEEEEDVEEEKEPVMPPSIAEAVTRFLKENDEDSICIVVLSIEDLDNVTNAKEAAGKDYADVPVYSFGVNGQTADAIKSQELSATILDDPYTMGLTSVQKIADGLDGNPTSGLIAPNELIVTSDNLDEAKTEHLLGINIRE